MSSTNQQNNNGRERDPWDRGVLFFHKVAKLMEGVIIALIPVGAAIDVVLILWANAEHLAKTVKI